MTDAERDRLRASARQALERMRMYRLVKPAGPQTAREAEQELRDFQADRPLCVKMREAQ